MKKTASLRCFAVAALLAVLLLVHARGASAGELEPLLSIERNGFGSSVGLLMNVWFIPYAGEDCWYGDPVFRPGIDIHRTTLMFRAFAPHGIDFGADLTLGLIHENEADFEAVEVGWAVAPELRVVGGYSHHAPFSAVAVTDHEYLLFTERPLGIEFMIPRGQPGLRLESRLGRYINATVGLYKQSEWEQDFLFAGRFVATPMKELPEARWGFGPDDEGYDEVRLGLGGSIMSYRGDVGRISGLGAEISAYWKFLSFSSEFIYFKHETGSGPQAEKLYDTRTVYGQVGAFVWKSRLLVAGRYQWYDGHLAAGQKAGRHRITGGLYAFFMKKRVRLALEYIHQIDEKKPELPGGGETGSDNEIALLEVRAYL